MLFAKHTRADVLKKDSSLAPKEVAVKLGELWWVWWSSKSWFASIPDCAAILQEEAACWQADRLEGRQNSQVIIFYVTSDPDFAVQGMPLLSIGFYCPDHPA
jgi:hypothetical protein